MSDDLKSTKAYPLFCTELYKIMAHADLIFNGTPDPEAAKGLVFSFHNIKGTAGFFGMEPLAAHAAEIERILKSDAKQVAAEWGRLQSELAAMQGLAATL